MPTHDRPLLLRRTLASLIAQTHADFQVVVVADSAAYVPPYQELHALHGRFTYVIRSGEPGPAASRNLGLQVAEGDYIVFLDDDDTFQPGHLAALARAIGSGQARPELLFCDFQVQNEDRTVFPPTPLSSQAASIADVTADSIYVRNRIPNSCLAYRRDVVAAVRHVTDLIIYEDWDFLLACLRGRTLRHVATRHGGDPQEPGDGAGEYAAREFARRQDRRSDAGAVPQASGAVAAGAPGAPGADGGRRRPARHRRLLTRRAPCGAFPARADAVRLARFRCLVHHTVAGAVANASATASMPSSTRL